MRRRRALLLVVVTVTLVVMLAFGFALLQKDSQPQGVEASSV